MELNVGDYGKHLFEIMVGERGRDRSFEHWEKIREKAEPLVRKLIKMSKKTGYKVVGYIEEVDKKPKRSKEERIRLAMEKDWSCQSIDLKEGDLVWLINDYDNPMDPLEAEPALVYEVAKKGVYLEMGGFNCDYIKILPFGQTVLKSPEDWENHDTYGEEYWLSRADELGF